MKPKASDVTKQKQKDDLDYYGDEAMGGHAAGPNTDDDTTRNVKKVYGNAPVPGEPFFMADEMDKDELEAGGITTPEKAEELIKKDEKKKAL